MLPLWEAAFFATFHALEAIIGFFILGIIWAYFRQKNDLIKTAFDVVCQHNISATMVALTVYTSIYILALFYSPFNYVIASILSCASYICFVYFLAASLITLFTKAMFIFAWTLVEELDEAGASKMTLLSTSIAAAGVTVIDNLGMKDNPLIFELLAADSNLKRYKVSKMKFLRVTYFDSHSIFI